MTHCLLWVGFLACFFSASWVLLHAPLTRGSWAFIGTTGGAMLAFAYLLGGVG